MFQGWFGNSCWNNCPLNHNTLDVLKGLVESGRLQPVVDKVIQAQDAELGFQHIDSANAFGKTVLRFRLVIFFINCKCEK